MIKLDMAGVMGCDHEGCTASTAVAFVLMGSGGFAFKAASADTEGWQVLLPSGPVGLGAPFRSTCPEHKQALPKVEPPKRVIQVGSAGPRRVNLDG